MRQGRARGAGEAPPPAVCVEPSWGRAPAMKWFLWRKSLRLVIELCSVCTGPGKARQAVRWPGGALTREAAAACRPPGDHRVGVTRLLRRVQPEVLPGDGGQHAVRLLRRRAVRSQACSPRRACLQPLAESRRQQLLLLFGPPLLDGCAATAERGQGRRHGGKLRFPGRLAVRGEQTVLFDASPGRVARQRPPVLSDKAMEDRRARSALSPGPSKPRTQISWRRLYGKISHSCSLRGKHFPLPEQPPLVQPDAG